MFASLQFRVEATLPAYSIPTFHIDPTLRKTLSAEEFNALHDSLSGALSRGPQGFPISGIALTVLDLSRDSDTTAGAIRACVCTFIDSLFRTDHRTKSIMSILLEPTMRVEIESPSQFIGDILSDLSGHRRGHIHDVSSRGSWTSIAATVPLHPLLGYASVLRSMTQGEGSFSMEYLEHQPVDDSTAQSMLAETS